MNDGISLTLHEVFAVRATADAEVFIVDVDITDMNGDRYRCDYVSSPDDGFGLAPFIRKWLNDNAGSYEILPYAPPAPTLNDVVAERKRRLSLGFDYDFGDARGVHHIGTTDSDMAGWEEVTQLSAALIAGGTPDFTIAVVTDTGPVVVTAAEWQQVLVAAGINRQPIWAASFALQSMDQIPADFTDNAWWTAT